MTDLRDFEQGLREDLFRTAQAVQVPAGAVDRAIRAGRAQDLAEPIAVRRGAGWTRPVAAAAAVLLIVSGVALASHWPFGDDARPTHRPTPSPTFPSPVPAPTSSSVTGPAPTNFRPGAPAVQPTRRYVIRPVTATGAPEPGWRVITYTAPFSDFACDNPSYVTVDPGAATCGGLGDSSGVCWKGDQPSTVLCVDEPTARTLIRVKIVGAFRSFGAPAHPRPLELVLDNGDDCMLNTGVGAAQIASHRTWFMYYSCGDGRLVFAPDHGDPIDMSSARWTVTSTARTDVETPITTLGVRAAYYVGTN